MARYRAKQRRRKELQARLQSWPTKEKRKRRRTWKPYQKIGPHSLHAPLRCWVYLLLSENGSLYVGQTTNLKNRLRGHHSKKNKCSTWGQRWRYLAAIEVRARSEALDVERSMQTADGLRRWVEASSPRMEILGSRYGFPRPCQIVHLLKKDSCCGPWEHYPQDKQ